MQNSRSSAVAAALAAVMALSTLHVPLSAAADERSAPASAEPLFETVDLASAGEGAHTWRIPALEVLPDGTLIAAYDRRNDSAADLPGDLDIMLRRSHDNGRTWTEPQVVADYDDGVGAGDPSLIVDDETGRIFVFYAYGPKGVGFFNSSKGNSNDSTTTLHADYSYSDDGGETWRTRRITEDIKDPSWKGMFASSGTGIQLSDGRLLQQYALNTDDGVFAAGAYSDDNGETWDMGEPVGPLMDENKTVELADGRVMLNSRTGSGAHRLVAYSEDGGLTYSEPEPDHELIDPTNNAAILRYDEDAPPTTPRAHWLLFSNTASTTARENLTVRMSCNDGRTWPISRVVDPGPSAYSTMVRLKDGTFGLFYERGPYRHLTFVRFNAAWLGQDCPTDAGRPKLAAEAAAPGWLTAGEAGTVDVTVTNHGHRSSVPGDVALDVPEGWSAAPDGRDVAPIEAGGSRTVGFTVTPSADLRTGEYDVTADVSAGATELSARSQVLAVGGDPLIDEPIARDLDGADDSVDLTDRLDGVARLDGGVIGVEFSTTEAPAAAALLSASDTSAPSTNLTLSLNRGTPYYEARVDGDYLARMEAAPSLADGERHTVALAVDGDGTSMYVDGAKVADTAAPAFFGHVAGLDGMWAGRNVDSGGAQWHYGGHLERVAVYGRD
ncbi:sialidase-1 [Spinactinospora alkalitolerans]|uniref:exo-alpha-sialidase n=1 Tax=Spinactinospora alkalitolerans TaxID=687207 RepID=A0A852U3M2_9ACTN|nr:exo-alpha-sialidase [Spinactinospora alkalitolerans]NYE48550.1 sialidase-1 [Spinactinospora alkalitolerans]